MRVRQADDKWVLTAQRAGSTTVTVMERPVYVAELSAVPDSVEYEPRRECVGDNEETSRQRKVQS